VDWEDRQLPVVVQSELLSISRSGLYYQPVAPSPEEIALKHRIDAIYTQWPFYGSRKVREALHREAVAISRKRVQRYMREMGLAGICPGPNLSKRRLEHQVYPYLLRGLAITAPDQVWGIDLTYIRMVSGWMYLVAILDWYSRYVVAWEMDQTLEMPFVLEAVERALATAKPGILNSDQGSHFTSPAYIDLVKGAGAQVSMDGRGRAMDNIFTERLWRSVKYEDIYLKDYQTPRETRQGVEKYLHFYNEERPHQSLGYQTPAEVYWNERKRMAA
jgi:putative transposase